MCERSMPAADKELHLGTRKHGQNEKAQARFEAETAVSIAYDPCSRRLTDMRKAESGPSGPAREIYMGLRCV